ncbi:hypothetical protein LCGC14_1638960 [marine sediment metagenome]|uniref:Uncharacterized protein n=1 Tax=marine sediment metagenome TaxID=412755 RepID=A0A0F9IMR6_9ZZZZ
MALTPAERQKRYRDAHPDRVQAQSERRTISGRAAKAAKRYRARHPEKAHAYDRKYAKDHPTYIKVTTRSLAAVKEEIKKCEVVCANCHRKRTALRVRDRLQNIENVSTRLLEQVFK